MTFSSAASTVSKPWPLSGLWARLFGPAQARTQMRRTHRELSGLSDDILRDIGLTRDEVHYFVQNSMEPRRHIV